MSEFDAVLAIAKARIPVEDLDDDKLASAVTEAEYAIRTYCKRWQLIEGSPDKYEELPAALRFVWADMALSAFYAGRQWDLSLAGDQEITRVDEGDTSVSFGAAPTRPAVDSTLGIDKHTATLNRFRRLYGDVREGVYYA